jgi:hemerythrin-like domain-containing protein
MLISELCETLKQNLEAQFELCRKLEELADNLPNAIDVQNCLSLARVISPTLRQAHEFEESTLFPELRTKFNTNKQLMETLERLRFEHWEDESFADELRESMVTYANELHQDQVNSLSYMLRGFFEGVRRHAAFEREHILPLLGRNAGQILN